MLMRESKNTTPHIKTQRLDATKKVLTNIYITIYKNTLFFSLKLTTQLTSPLLIWSDSW